MQTVQYTDEQKATVRQIWAFRAGRRIAETERILRTGEFDELGISNLTGRTIRNWIAADNWEELASDELYQHSGSLRWLAQSELRLAVPEAARFLREAVVAARENMFVPLRDKFGERVLEDGVPVTVLDPKVMGIGVNAAQLLLDRGGFSPTGTRDVGGVDSPPSQKADLMLAIADIDDAEGLQRIEAVIRDQQGIGRRIA